MRWVKIFNPRNTTCIPPVKKKNRLANKQTALLSAEIKHLIKGFLLASLVQNDKQKQRFKIKNNGSKQKRAGI
jgi:hypothetical protein